MRRSFIAFARGVGIQPKSVKALLNLSKELRRGDKPVLRISANNNDVKHQEFVKLMVNSPCYMGNSTNRCFTQREMQEYYTEACNSFFAFLRTGWEKVDVLSYEMYQKMEKPYGLLDEFLFKKDTSSWAFPITKDHGRMMAIALWIEGNHINGGCFIKVIEGKVYLWVCNTPGAFKMAEKFFDLPEQRR